jgi:hypothetical protein
MSKVIDTNSLFRTTVRIYAEHGFPAGCTVQTRRDETRLAVAVNVVTGLSMRGVPGLELKAPAGGAGHPLYR